MPPRSVMVTDLVGATEIAHRLGMGKASVVHDWIGRHPDFPEPIARLKAGHVWAWPDVEAWARATGRIKGSPASDQAGKV
jgi:predicted DNA-binding transcriptional regulator AlpA